MDAGFAIIGFLTLAGAAGAMTLRNLVHCALCLVLAFGGFALLYLKLGAEFAGFAQLLVYVGAVAVLIVFALLLTRNIESTGERIGARDWPVGVAIGVILFVLLGAAIVNSPFSHALPETRANAPTVKEIGVSLMTDYVLPLEAVALLLTAAMIGAVIIAVRETDSRK